MGCKGSKEKYDRPTVYFVEEPPSKADAEPGDKVPRPGRFETAKPQATEGVGTEETGATSVKGATSDTGPTSAAGTDSAKTGEAKKDSGENDAKKAKATKAGESGKGPGRETGRTSTFNSKIFPITSKIAKREPGTQEAIKSPQQAMPPMSGGAPSKDRQGSPPGVVGPQIDLSVPGGSRPSLRESLRNAGDRLVVILFYEQECEDCEAVRMLYEELVIAYPDVLFLEADVMSNVETVKQLRLKFLPTFVAYRNHLEVGRLVSVDVMDLEEFIQHNIIDIPKYDPSELITGDIYEGM